MTATATHPGRICLPATDIGVRGTLFAVPQAVNEWVVLDDRVDVGHAFERTDDTGALLNGGLKVPIVANLLWTLLFVPDSTGQSFTLGTFNLNTSGVDIRALVPTDLIVVDPSMVADLTVTATQMAAVNARVDAIAPTGSARAVGKGELVLNVADFGIVGDGTTQSLTALTTKLATLTGPAAVYFPRSSGVYVFATPLPNQSHIRYHGDGMGDPTNAVHLSTLRWTSGSMLAPTTLLTSVVFEDLAIECTGTAAHLVDLGATGGLIFSRFARCDLHPKVDTASILAQNGTGNFFGNIFDGCKMWRQATHTVPAFDITATASGNNGNVWRGGWWHSQLCPNGPFFRADSASATTYISGYAFTDIIGEQNTGGMIHLYGANGVVVRDVRDYDAGATAYTDDVFKMGTGSGGLLPLGLELAGSGTVAVAVFASGKAHVSFSGGGGHRIGRVVNGGGNGVVIGPATGRVIDHNGSVAKGIVTTAVDRVLTGYEHTVVGNGPSRTVTLPDPAALLFGGTVPPGREFVVKNIHATTLAVVSAGSATIDGAASVVLRTFESARFVTDGTNWLTGGKPAAAYDWTAPAAVVRQNISRAVTTNATLAPLVSGRLSLVGVELLAGDVVTGIRFLAGTTAAGTPTHQWFALYSGALAKLGVTANDTTTAWAASAKKELALTAPYTITASGLYYLGICVVATTVPTLTGVALLAADAAEVPIMTGFADTGLTTPATAPATAIALTSQTSMFKGSVT
jgi:hypothetical protein